MKFIIGNVEIAHGNLQVEIFYDEDMEQREAFGFPIEYAKDDRYIDEIKKILKKREKVRTVTINKEIIGKEFETD